MSTINTLTNPSACTQLAESANVSGEVMRSPRITDLYRETLGKAMHLRNEAKTKPTAFVRSNFRERAQSLEIRATNFAHCIAKYGDQDIASMNLDLLLAEARGLVCNGSNPWAQGLALIQEVVREISEQGNATGIDSRP